MKPVVVYKAHEVRMLNEKYIPNMFYWTYVYRIHYVCFYLANKYIAKGSKSMCVCMSVYILHLSFAIQIKQ